MIKLIFVGILTLYAARGVAADCSDAFKFIPLTNVTSPVSYMRVHPSGQFLLFSGANAVIVDLRDLNHPKEIQTLMNREAYPVETAKGWRWMASPNHDDKMRYYRFDDLLLKGVAAEPVFEDEGLNQFYHSSAELPDSTPKKIHFRTSIWSLLKYRDYTAKLESSGVSKKVEKTETKNLCPNLKTVGFRQPILSKDGTEIAGLTKNSSGIETTKVFRILTNSCKLDYDIGFNTGKVSFSYPKPGTRPKIVFTATIAHQGENLSASQKIRSGVWLYDPNKKQTFPISPAELAFNVSYPGFTEDGRIFYITNKAGIFGITMADGSRLTTPGCQ